MTVDVRLVENEFGFFEVDNKPSADELAEYYQKKYYQRAAGSYELSYSEEEVRYFYNKIEEKVFVVEKFKKLVPTSVVLDVGCGEGWVLDYFAKRQIEAFGLDFSTYGCEQFNKHCLNKFIPGDIYANILNLQRQGNKYDLIWLDNVLEHVIDPLNLLSQCCQMLTDDGVIMVEVPNDFSVIQKYLLQGGYIDRQYWVAYPDHLSYFNRTGLDNLGAAAGLINVFSMGDFPIDLNLLNHDTNYYADKSKGKACYKAKINFENLLHSISIEHSLKLYESFINLGIGRCLTSFFRKS